MPRVKLFYPKEYLIYFYSLSVFLFFSTVQGCPGCHAVRRARRKTFLREESERLFENNNKQTSTPSKHLLSAKTYFFNVLSIFFTQKNKLFRSKHIYVFQSSFCFFSNGSIFLSPRKKPWRTIALLFSSHVISSHFHCPRCCCENNLFYPKDYLIYFYSLSVFLFFHIPTCCHAVRRARRKVFREKIGAMLNFFS